MRLFFPVRRATLTIPSGPAEDPDRDHLHILLTDPVGEDRLVLLVSVSSVKAGLYHDPTCYLYPGDHEYVIRQSWVVYSRAQTQPANKLERGAREGVFRGKEAMSDPIMARICQGLLDSRHSKPSIQSFYLATLPN